MKWNHEIRATRNHSPSHNHESTQFWILIIYVGISTPIWIYFWILKPNVWHKFGTDWMTQFWCKNGFDVAYLNFKISNFDVILRLITNWKIMYFGSARDRDNGQTVTIIFCFGIGSRRQELNCILFSQHKLATTRTRLWNRNFTSDQQP